MATPYCASRFQTNRRPTSEVRVGEVGVGGANPIRLQSMTTSDTQDIDTTVRQSIALAEVGCEIVRVTAPNVKAARCLREIRQKFSAAGFADVPLVADIHFLPSAAMEAAEHVEKIRVNPGNYADKKKFAVREYSDSQYGEELERLHEGFSPLVKRCAQLGRALRIGTNHGSLSDRIMNRYGDTPLGMVESALEFIRIAESHGFRDIILSMKASNPKVMIQAYRLLVERMTLEHMHYPLHLGVTEAGDGEDGRIKSAIGIGSLLVDGLGDTIRVSLTEDSVYEIPVARAIADKAMSLWVESEHPDPYPRDSIDPFEFSRRTIRPVSLGENAPISPEQPPRIVTNCGTVPGNPQVWIETIRKAQTQLKDTSIEAVLLWAHDNESAYRALSLAPLLAGVVECLFLETDDAVDLASISEKLSFPAPRVGFVRAFAGDKPEALALFLNQANSVNFLPVVELAAEDVAGFSADLKESSNVLLTLRVPIGGFAHPDHAIGGWRRLIEALRTCEVTAPVWIRNIHSTEIRHTQDFLSRVLESSILTGSLLADGIGDVVSIETETDLVRATRLAYNVLQGAGARISKTEFVACPSCGRTLFDLQSTTQRIRSQTGHLKGVKIAIMGCIVNGPGEMADADFGYVGGAPGKINLYVGKECVRYNIPANEADQRLIELIKDHGKWTDPEPEVVETSP